MRILTVLASVVLLGMTGAASADEFCGRGDSSAITMTEWSITPEDEDTNILVTGFRSELAQKVRMIDASAGFADALGKVIATFSLDRDIELAPGDKFEQSGRWGPYTFERLLVLRPEEVTGFVCVRAVLYDDGTVEEFN